MFSLFDVAVHSGIFVKLILFILAITAIWSWGLFFEKFTTFKIKIALAESFKREFDSGEMLDAIYNRLSAKKKIFAPFARIFFFGMKELNSSNIRGIDFSEPYSEGIKKNIRERIISCMEIERLKIVEEMHSNVSGLATIAFVMPFVGLLGTVWGIMNSFYSVSAARTLNFAIVVPGIAESLMTTVFGLFTSIPSVIFYNILVSKLNGFIIDSEIFSLDLANVLSRELDILTTNAYSRKIEEKNGALPQ